MAETANGDHLDHEEDGDPEQVRDDAAVRDRVQRRVQRSDRDRGRGGERERAPRTRGGERSGVPARYDVWDRPRGGRRPKLSREAIVAAAIEIADAEGLEAVSIRRVANELGVRAMSLYGHIDRKEDLLDLMYDEVAAHVLIEGELPDDWREAFMVIARKERAAGLRHPWMFQLAGSSPRVGPNGLRHADQSLGVAAKLTDDPLSQTEIVTSIDHYMLGFTLREQRIDEMGRNGLQEVQNSLMGRPYFRSWLEDGHFQHLKPVLDAGIFGQASFEKGLNWLLDGIEREYGGA